LFPTVQEGKKRDKGGVGGGKKEREDSSFSKKKGTTENIKTREEKRGKLAREKRGGKGKCFVIDQGDEHII